MALIKGNAKRNILRGGTQSDTILGFAANDDLYGNGGNDLLDGGTGNDLMVGGAGNDTYVVNSRLDRIIESGPGSDLVRSAVTWALGANIEKLTLTGAAHINATGNGLANVIIGNAGNNVINGGGGADVMAGGGGNDTFFVDNAGDVTSDSAGIDTVFASVDHTIGAGIENLILTFATNGTGNTGDNTITGNTAANVLSGGDGNDVLIGGGSGDTLDGGGGTGDFASYETSAGAVTALLQPLLFFVKTGDAQGDTYIGIENLRGTNNTTAVGIVQAGTYIVQDVLAGDGGTNVLEGLAGNDMLEGRGGPDTLNGGTGEDSASYLSASLGVVASLIAPLTNTNDAAGDTYISIENLIGSNAVLSGDTLTGNTGNNRLFGLGGADTLNGGDGDDWLVGDSAFGVNVGTHADTLNGGLGSDTIDYSGSFANGIEVNLHFQQIFGGEADGDTISSIENVIGTNNDDNVIMSNAANNFEGGDGSDGVSYEFSGAGVTVNLATQTVSGGFAAGDTISGVENATGSNSSDILTAAAGGSRLNGLDGDDTLNGGVGADFLDGGTGLDTLTGGGGNDTYFVGDGDTVVELAGGGDADLARAFASYTLDDNIENGEMIDSFDPMDLTGNTLDNILTGSFGNNRLDGGAGDDQMAGLGGDDTYVVDSALDSVEEFFGQGTDTVEAGITFSLEFEEIENVTLTGTGNTDATGNGSANVLIGNSGNNILEGLTGADSLTGNGGIDRFVLHAGTGLKTISDFTQLTDLLRISTGEFALSSGLVDGVNFFNNAIAAQGGAGQEIFFDNASSTLFYDSDGIAGDEVAIAVLTGVTANLTVTDFDLIA